MTEHHPAPGTHFFRALWIILREWHRDRPVRKFLRGRP